MDDLGTFNSVMKAETLQAVADEELQKVTETFPLEIRNLIHECPIHLLLEPTVLQQEELGDEAWELLGLFEGNSRLESAPTDLEQMPRISLFLNALWDEAEGDVTQYREEVKLTYLHEWAHYLGWDEDEVEARGLG